MARKTTKKEWQEFLTTHIVQEVCIDAPLRTMLAGEHIEMNLQKGAILQDKRTGCFMYNGKFIIDSTANNAVREMIQDSLMFWHGLIMYSENFDDKPELVDCWKLSLNDDTEIITQELMQEQKNIARIKKVRAAVKEYKTNIFNF